MVYDVTNRKTFEHIVERWLNAIPAIMRLKVFTIFLVGNKVDLVEEEERELSDEDAEEERVKVVPNNSNGSSKRQREVSFEEGMVRMNL